VNRRRFLVSIVRSRCWWAPPYEGVHTAGAGSRRAGSADALARQKTEAAELARLKRENKRLEQENEILKRAASFFAREAVPT